MYGPEGFCDSLRATGFLAQQHEFWQCVESGREPDFSYDSPRAQSLLQKLYPHTDGSTIALDDTIQYWHEVKGDAQKHARTYQAVVDTADAHILKALGNASVGALPFGGGCRREETTCEAYTVQAKHRIECRFVASGNRQGESVSVSLTPMCLR